MNLHRNTERDTSESGAKPKLEFVLKCDSDGSIEAVVSSILKTAPPEVDISIIHSGIGYINESDILMAETASRLIVGFQTDVLPGIDAEMKEHAVEARLYNVIYDLTADIRNIAQSIIPAVPREETLGSAKVIALFKSCRRGIIIGCEIQSGYLAVGNNFRIISAMGPVYAGKIESMHIEKNAVQKASAGQQAGIKIRDFNNVKTGDLVECFRPLPLRSVPVWQPTGGIIRKTS